MKSQMKTVLNILMRAKPALRSFGVVAVAASLYLPVAAQEQHYVPTQNVLYVHVQMPRQGTVIEKSTYVRLAQSTISASEAKAIALSSVKNSEVVDISRDGGFYRVRLIRKDGRVVDVFIDAKSGRVKK